MIKVVLRVLVVFVVFVVFVATSRAGVIFMIVSFVFGVEFFVVFGIDNFVFEFMSCFCRFSFVVIVVLCGCSDCVRDKKLKC